MTEYNRDDQPYTPPPKYGPRFTAVDVRRVREENQCGMVTAKQELMREQILADLEEGRRTQNVPLLYDVIEYIMKERLTPDW